MQATCFHAWGAHEFDLISIGRYGDMLYSIIWTYDTLLGSQSETCRVCGRDLESALEQDLMLVCI